MGNYRSKLDIIADMLQILKKSGAKKTQIMYQANLSYKLLTKYIAETLNSCLIHFDDDSEVYTITAKGQVFLEEYEKFSTRNSILEKQINDLNERKKGLEELCSN